MRILEINSCNFGSTGNIMLQIAEKARLAGHGVQVAYPDSRSNRKKEVPDHLVIGNRFSRNLHIQLGKYIGMAGMLSYISTLYFLRKVNKFHPDVIHLHNLHGSYINLPLLFRYIKERNIPIIWTLHDCWSFTGQCPCFTLAKCNKWKAGCHNCPQYRSYPETYIDRTKTMWKLKKEWFTGVPNMTIVTPSQWLADLVKESFLKDYPVEVIHNGIDLNIFKPQPSNFREKYHCEDKYILLGVAFGWGRRKGLDVFAELAKRLDSKYQIVLVGTDDGVDKLLPKNIISIHRTSNQQKLAEIYTVADLFVNPTREENYPTVNMESIACGTPVLTFRTGGSPEILDDKTGCVVDCDDIDAMQREIVRICTEQPYSHEDCMIRAEQFNMRHRFEDYLDLYESVI